MTNPFDACELLPVHTVSADAAKHLAITYASFIAAMDANSETDMRLWGCLLRRRQSETGITLISAKLLKDY